MYCHFGHFVGNTVLLDVTEVTRIHFASFHCDTCNTFSTHSGRPTAEIKVKMVTQIVGKDSEQNLVGCFDVFNLVVAFYFALQGKIYPQYHVTWNSPFIGTIRQ